MSSTAPVLTSAFPPPPLVDSRRDDGGWRGRLLARGFMSAFGAVPPGASHPLPAPWACPPHAQSARWGLTHFGIMIPDLPAPHHFLACAAILGASGMRVFDIDSAVRPEDGPRHTATLVHGTAAATTRAFTRYRLPQGMALADDGSQLRFGDDLEIAGRFPDFTLRSQRSGFAVDLRLTATGDITWFARSPLYQHFSLLARYRGTLEHAGERSSVSGLCTYEYARGMSPHALVNRSLPRALKLPWDFFTYQVITLDADTQLLLAHCRVAGSPALTAVYLRQAGQGSARLDADIEFEVLATQAAPEATPEGRAAWLPERFRWLVRGRDGLVRYEIFAVVDTPMLFGLGSGHVGGFRWEGTREGRPAAGRGYLEYIDQRDC